MKNQTNKGFVGIPVLIFAFLGLLVACGFMYTNYNSTWKSDSQVPVLSENETEEWKTYKNEEYGFEFKYPKDWIKSQYSVSSISSFSKEGLAPPVLDIQVGNLISLADVKKADEAITGEKVETKIIPIDGQEALTTHYYGSTQSPPGFRIYFFRNNVGFSINTFPEYADIILSSLKFTNTKSDVSNWKTYKNEKYGITFKYPRHWGDITENDEMGKDSIKPDHLIWIQPNNTLKPDVKVIVRNNLNYIELDGLEDMTTEGHRMRFSTSVFPRRIEKDGPVIGYYKYEVLYIEKGPAVTVVVIFESPLFENEAEAKIYNITEFETFLSTLEFIN